MQDRGQYIAEMVRREDRDRFLMALFVPADRRDDVLALYAFNAELARIRGQVSETMIGRMKLQWWRDVIEAVYAGRGVPLGNPVTEALASCIIVRKLTRAHFDEILTTREREMDSDDAGFTFSDALDLERYAEGTSSRLIDLVVEVLGATAETSKSAARHVGIGYALSGILRAVLFHAAENRLMLPRDVLNNIGVTGVQDVQSARNSAATASTVAEIARTAEAHLAKARTFKIERAALPALLGAGIASQYLSQLKAAHYDVSDSRVVHARASVLRLTWNAWRGKL